MFVTITRGNNPILININQIAVIIPLDEKFKLLCYTSLNQVKKPNDKYSDFDEKNAYWINCKDKKEYNELKKKIRSLILTGE